MSQYLKFFTAVGDEQPAQLDELELHADSEELNPAAGQFPTTLTFREALQRLYSSERFQVYLSDVMLIRRIVRFLVFDAKVFYYWENTHTSKLAYFSKPKDKS